MNNVKKSIDKVSSKEHLSVFLSGNSFPGKDEISKEIQAAIQSSDEVQEAIRDLDETVTRKNVMENELSKMDNRKLELTRRKRELSIVYGNDPDADLKELEIIHSELSVIDDARRMLSDRLQPDGEQRRVVEDKKYAVEHSIAQAVKPLHVKYEQIVNKQFDAIIAFLECYHMASYTAWPRKTESGLSIQYSAQARLQNKILLNDGMRLADYADDIRSTINGSMQSVLNHSKTV